MKCYTRMEVTYMRQDRHWKIKAFVQNHRDKLPTEPELGMLFDSFLRLLSLSFSDVSCHFQLTKV